MGANDMSFRGSLHNRFDIEIIDKSSGNVREKAVAYNIVTEQLWARLFSKSNTLTDYANYIHYGTGTGEPSVNDKSLFEFKRAIACETPTYTYDFVNGTMSARRRIQISETMDVGIAITEMGIAYGNTAETLCTHAMVLDANGKPYGILKTDQDVINIYSTIYLDFSTKQGSEDGIYFTNHMYTYGTSMYTRYSPLRVFLGSTSGNDYFSGIIASQNPTIMATGGSGFHSMTHSVTYQNVGNEFGDKYIRRYTLTAARHTIEEGNVSGGIGAITITHRQSSMTGETYYPNSLLSVGSGWHAGSQVYNESVGTGDGTAKDFPLKFRYATGVEVFVNGVLESNVETSYIPNDSYPSTMIELYSGQSSPNKLFPLMNAYHSSDYVRISGHAIPGNHFYARNPFHAIGIDTIQIDKQFKISWSNNMVDWTEIGTNESTSLKRFELDSQAKHAEYFKFEKNGAFPDNSYLYIYFTSSGDLMNAIHFRVPPADGAVITANYYTQTIAKDENHVLDFSMTFDFSDPGIE